MKSMRTLFSRSFASTVADGRTGSARRIADISKLFTRMVLPIALLTGTKVAMATEYSDFVTPIGVGIYTIDASSTNWAGGDKGLIRFSAKFSTAGTPCNYNAAWFLRSDKDVLSAALSAIATGKKLQVTLSDAHKVGGVVCQIVMLETQP